MDTGTSMFELKKMAAHFSHVIAFLHKLAEEPGEKSNQAVLAIAIMYLEEVRKRLGEVKEFETMLDNLPREKGED